MHRERRIDFWISLATVAALFVPIWGVLLEPSRLVSLPLYLLVVGLPAFVLVVAVLIYAWLNNRVLLNRFLVGYGAGLVGSAVVHASLLIGKSMGLAPDLIGLLGKLMLGQDVHSPQTVTSMVLGAAYHYLLNGAAWAAAYSLVFGKSPWWFGSIFGMGIAAVLVISPPFYKFGFNLAGVGHGPLTLFGIALAHFAYGSIVGYIVNRYVFPEVGMEGARAVKPTYA